MIAATSSCIARRRHTDHGDCQRAGGFKVSGHIPFSFDLAEAGDPLASVEHDWSFLPQCSDFRAQFDGRNQSKTALLAAMSRQRCARVLDHLAKRGATCGTHNRSTRQLQTDACMQNRRGPRRCVLLRTELIEPARSVVLCEEYGLKDDLAVPSNPKPLHGLA